MCKAMLKQLVATILVVVGFFMIIFHEVTDDCSKEMWCGNPNPGDIGWAFAVTGMILCVLSCLP